jgi:hypothetical protein
MILGPRTTQKALQVMVYAEDSSLQQALQLRLKNEGFRAVSQSSRRSFVELYQRGKPDMIILVVLGEPEGIKPFVRRLTKDGISFKSTPTFLLTDSSVPRVASLFEEGIEDIVVLDDNFNILLDRIRRSEIKISARGKRAEEIVRGGSTYQGRLADMTLVDLLNVLGPSRKTVRVAVQPDDPDASILVLYLDRGQIGFAERNDSTGAEAIYPALDWTQGSWTVESVATEDLPPTNCSLSNELILMQGCLKLGKKAGDQDL